MLKPVTGSLPMNLEMVIRACGWNYLNEPNFLKMNLELRRFVARVLSPLIVERSSLMRSLSCSLTLGSIRSLSK